MSDVRDPPRLLATLDDERDPLRLALEAGREEQPSASQLESLWSRLPMGGPLGGGEPPGGGEPSPGDSSGGGLDPSGGGSLAAQGGGLAAKAAGASGLAKLIGVAALGATVIGGSAYLMGGRQGAAPLPSAPVEVRVEPPAPVPSPGVAREEPSLAEPPASAASAPPALAAGERAEVGGPPAASAPSEIELLKQAQSALAADPARTLRLVGRAAELYPRGALGQEREVLRIQALAGVGQRAAAVSAARAFRARHPESPHVRRLEALFPELATP